MRRLLLLLAICLFGFVPWAVGAQSSQHLASVKVDIWPEYDRTDVLIIEHLQFPADTKLPLTFSLRIPSNSRINAVALVNSSGELINTPYQSSIQGNWNSLSITVNSLTLQVEYYDPLVKDGTTRHITYEWPGDAAVDNLVVNFLAPPSSSAISIDPPAASNAPGQSGFMNYVLPEQKLILAQSFTAKIDYNRSTDDVAISGLPIVAATQPGADTPGRVTMPVNWAWALGGIGVLLVAGGIFGILSWRRSVQAEATSTRHRHTGKGPQAEAIYCHECGNRAQPGDIFCRTCGTRLRLPV